MQSSCRLSPRLASQRAPSAVIQTRANLLDRFMRVFRSNVNQVIKGMEDPEKILDQAVIDMQKDLAKVRHSYAEISSMNKRMEKQRSNAEATAAAWYQRAEMAMQKGDETLAREALTRKQQQQEIVDTTTEQMAAQEQ